MLCVPPRVDGKLITDVPSFLMKSVPEPVTSLGKYFLQDIFALLYWGLIDGLPTIELQDLMATYCYCTQWLLSSSLRCCVDGCLTTDPTSSLLMFVHEPVPCLCKYLFQDVDLPRSTGA